MGAAAMTTIESEDVKCAWMKTESSIIPRGKDSPCPLARDSRRLKILSSDAEVRRLLQLLSQALAERKR